MVSEATSTYAHIGVVKANFSVNTHSAIKLLKTGYLDQNLQMQHSVERYIFYSLVLENLHPTLNKLRRLNI